MKFSIITAAYNNISSIQDAINSIRCQNYLAIEYVVIDGSSTDGTKDILEQSNIDIFISEPDNGIYDALNKGIKKATGDIIGFVHSDDILACETIISEIAEVFNKTNADGVFGDLQYVSKEDTNKVIRFWKSKPFNIKNLKYGWMPAHPTLFLKKSVYEKHGCFDTSFKIASDYDFMLRILSDNNLKFEYLPKVISKMRVGGESNKSFKNIILKSKEDIRAMKKNNIGGICTLIFKNFRKIIQFF